MVQIAKELGLHVASEAVTESLCQHNRTFQDKNLLLWIRKKNDFLK